ncbi:virulence RhuM family protein [Thermodesulfobacteriota bacterium]
MDVVLYNAEDGAVQLEVKLDRETVWLNQRRMAQLFDKDSDTIGLHIRNIYKEGELSRKGTTEDSSVVQNEGGRQVRRKVNFYNLDVIISVGYRVKSKRGTQFRQWATRVLREHLVRGFTLNEQRLMEQDRKLADLRRTVGLLEQTLVCTDSSQRGRHKHNTGCFGG